MTAGRWRAAVVALVALLAGCRERIELDSRVDAGRCAAQGQACGVCCAGACVEGVCRVDPLPCRPMAEACSAPSECCSGLCEGGVCQPLSGCAPTGESCVESDTCCSRICASAGTEPVCQPLGGCRPSGERCALDAECCAGRCEADATGLPRCTEASECAAAGEICRVTSDPAFARECCSGSCRASGPAGVDRGALQAACVSDGGRCASPEDCCEGNCVLDLLGELRCRAGCLPPGLACTRDGDCCGGRCGADGRCTVVVGVCAPLGASCVDATTCCSRFCAAGRCAP